ncbi:periplasmic substrate-binding component of an ABC superfamily zinc transporter [Tatumella ptyseos ATCC 33301]|uniref:Periplasmic substrate-binding component of an ABC superfamily zinc transporter n=2 Tax=Tatumella ptyseos TaxID=82987 RepID=A0A085JF18_9GAMM|nr:zinc ABC transporter substrate-binding protein [Tatumella ptyseos]KFD19064.1 periplasmic substrate-binding component of an ABC superfamily zinc transporter [Tatumella ptyseos ATCC 33301]SQK75241.1 Saliva-binding protein [Tatumella ptyseos]
MHINRKSATHALTVQNATPRGLSPRIKAAGVLAAMTALLSVSSLSLAAENSPSHIHAIGIENQYADIISQIGGKYVEVTSLISDPNTDPHAFEASPGIARQIAHATLIVENGAGYDDWADKLIAASPNAKRNVINVHSLLKLPENTANPHLWYDPQTMPAVADAIADQLASKMPEHAAEFRENAGKFRQSMEPVNAAITAFKNDFPDTPVAVTEPVADYLLKAMGAKILTPEALEYGIMNDIDPAPQLVSEQNELLAQRKVRVFVYNQQVTDPVTSHFLALARKNHIPVAGVYETMPEPGYHYQSWMLAEISALRHAVSDQVSTESLIAGKR